jgi:hypothetical protein
MISAITEAPSRLIRRISRPQRRGGARSWQRVLFLHQSKGRRLSGLSLMGGVPGAVKKMAINPMLTSPQCVLKSQRKNVIDRESGNFAYHT